MPEDTLGITAELIVRDFELQPPEQSITEEELLQMLAGHIAGLIEHRLEYLLSMMYRLDIDERKVDRALSPYSEEPANLALARLVLERQKQRAFTKQHYKQKDLEDLDGLEL